ncbi:MAG: OmpA family protein [Thermoanaerobaculia bacterium]|nr:OmpA family protein [Thermoanaerobaculia bacterium]
MNRTATLVLALFLTIALLWGGYAGWQLIRSLRTEVETLGGRVVALEGDLAASQDDLATSQEKAQAAEERANQADQVAGFMEERAHTAESNAATAAEIAAAERTRAENALTAAERALAEAGDAEAARKLAEEQRVAAVRKAEDSELDAWRARRKAEELERQRNRDLDRLESALGRLAETRRTALGVVMNLGDSIEFDFNEAVLRPEAKELLSRIAGVLLTAEDFGIQVYGHTDDVGSPEYNLELSERRAGAVRDYLLEAGIRPDLIAMKGFGMRAPLAQGSDEAARQRNRRVEIAIVQITESTEVDEDLAQPEP